MSEILKLLVPCSEREYKGIMVGCQSEIFDLALFFRRLYKNENHLCN
jgi:hypothetical protein